jgi:hypothetical protein
VVSEPKQSVFLLRNETTTDGYGKPNPLSSTGLPMKIQVFWIVLLCCWMAHYWHFGGWWCLHLNGQAVQERCLTQKMNTQWSIAVSATSCPTAQCHFAEQEHSCEKLKSHTGLSILVLYRSCEFTLCLMWGFRGSDSEGRHVGCGTIQTGRNVRVFHTILLSPSSVHYGWTAQCQVTEDISFDFLCSVYKIIVVNTENVTCVKCESVIY